MPGPLTWPKPVTQIPRKWKSAQVNWTKEDWLNTWTIWLNDRNTSDRQKSDQRTISEKNMWLIQMVIDKSVNCEYQSVMLFVLCLYTDTSIHYVNMCIYGHLLSFVYKFLHAFWFSVHTYMHTLYFWIDYVYTHILAYYTYTIIGVVMSRQNQHWSLPRDILGFHSIPEWTGGAV